MIVIDTNVASEPLKPQPDARVMAWLASIPPVDLYITAVSVAEMLAGMAVMPDGKRKSGMFDGFERLLARLFQDRILQFDEPAARNYAKLFAAMRAAGRAITLFDCQIAAIAKAHHASLATRDVRPFLDAGLSVVNPWAEG
jgi:hypothetical protein